MGAKASDRMKKDFKAENAGIVEAARIMGECMSLNKIKVTEGLMAMGLTIAIVCNENRHAEGEQLFRYIIDQMEEVFVQMKGGLHHLGD